MRPARHLPAKNSVHFHRRRRLPAGDSDAGFSGSSPASGPDSTRRAILSYSVVMTLVVHDVGVSFGDSFVDGTI